MIKKKVYLVSVAGGKITQNIYICILVQQYLIWLNLIPAFLQLKKLATSSLV